MPRALSIHLPRWSVDLERRQLLRIDWSVHRLEPPFAEMIELPSKQLPIEATIRDDGALGQIRASLVQLSQQIDRLSVELGPS